MSNYDYLSFVALFSLEAEREELAAKRAKSRGRRRR